ncbi:glycosyltransferase family 2 protein [Vibrio breoganii]|uniref:glycosyltransferase family 2 protein n=1 Tax=Vibrio breoganii TaxID=553239 RepID=UPI000C84DC7D|nr:glycosyltransferase family 2 protein [Vibrio breoganii]PML40663.1 hypothetical protein BCT77_00435 [Vibrio breoganii]PMO71033.1 hypothetical protein BCT02_02075 [Vibrio breoganii]PMO90475.1 hypothetical protein BCS99_04685 [Vibrio breoganii]
MKKNDEEKPKLSIICMCFNHEKFVAQTIDGFLLQEVDFDIEIIIHDDCSTDNSLNIINEYKNKYPELIRVISQERNIYSRGEKALHYLFEACRGEYIALCEGDDYWVDPCKLQIQVDFLDSNPEYIISGHDAFVIDEKGNLLSESKLPDRYKRDFTSSELQMSKCWALTLSWCFRKVDGLIIEEMRNVVNEDNFMLSYLGNYGKYKYHANISPAAYRVHAGGVWSSLNPEKKFLTQSNSWYWLSKYYFRIGNDKLGNYFKDLAIKTIYSNISFKRIAVEFFIRLSFFREIRGKLFANK